MLTTRGERWRIDLSFSSRLRQVCNSSIYRLYRVIENDDPDDFEYFLDPPFGHMARLGCDGKAGRTMKTIAVNCRPLHPTDADEE